MKMNECLLIIKRKYVFNNEYYNLSVNDSVSSIYIFFVSILINLNLSWFRVNNISLLIQRPTSNIKNEWMKLKLTKKFEKTFCQKMKKKKWKWWATQKQKQKQTPATFNHFKAFCQRQTAKKTFLEFMLIKVFCN